MSPITYHMIWPLPCHLPFLHLSCISHSLSHASPFLVFLTISLPKFSFSKNPLLHGTLSLSPPLRLPLSNPSLSLSRIHLPYQIERGSCNGGERERVLWGRWFYERELWWWAEGEGYVRKRILPERKSGRYKSGRDERESVRDAREECWKREMTWHVTTCSKAWW